MKLLIDAHVFDGMFQGSRTYIKGLYNALTQMRPDWTFYFAASTPESLSDEIEQRPNVTFIQLKSRSKYGRLLWEFPRLIKKLKADYAHFQHITPPFGGSKYIVTIHDVLLSDPESRSYFRTNMRLVHAPLFKRSARKAAICLTVSKYSKSKISSLISIPEHQVHITPNAAPDVDLKATPTVSIEHKFGCKNYFLFVSRLEPRKNHIGLLKAFLERDLDKRGYQLVFIGQEDYGMQELKEFADQNKERLSGKFHHFSGVGENDMDAFYRETSCVVYPSFAEGFGIPPLEGAVYLKPVICSNRTAMQEFDFFRYFIDPADTELLGDCLEKAVSEEDTAYREVIRRQVMERYNWSRSASILAEILEGK